MFKIKVEVQKRLNGYRYTLHIYNVLVCFMRETLLSVPSKAASFLVLCISDRATRMPPSSRRRNQTAWSNSERNPNLPQNISPSSLLAEEKLCMKTPWQGNAIRFTFPLWGESTGHRWIPITKVQWCRARCFALLARTTHCKISRWFEMSWLSCHVAVTKLVFFICKFGSHKTYKLTCLIL